MTTRPLQTVDLFLLPELAASDLSGHIAVVIDTLRATSTMTVALENGARSITPAVSVDEARQIAAALEAEEGEPPLLCGEEDARRITGFDLGNSPSEMEDRVYGRSLVMKTTNGTPALRRAMTADVCIALSMLNAQAVAWYLARATQPIAIIAAGGKGAVNLEDTLTAGLFVQELQRIDQYRELSDSVLIALRLAEAYRDDLTRGLRMCRHGRSLMDKGFERDIEWCAALNSYSTVPVASNGRLVRASSSLGKMLAGNE